MLFHTSHKNIPGAYGTAAGTHCTDHKIQTAPEDDNKLSFVLRFP
jgi:hypothetical protein